MPLAQVLLAGLVAMAATAERQRPELLVTAAMPELVAMAVTAATVSQSEQIQTQELAAMLALAVTAETAERQHLEPLAMVATEPMLARPETADLRQAAATAATAGTAPAVATEARAVVPLASTATVATVDLPRTERTEVTLARLLEHWAVAAATAGLRHRWKCRFRCRISRNQRNLRNSRQWWQRRCRRGRNHSNFWDSNRWHGWRRRNRS
jgi:hypothetical protein